MDKRICRNCNQEKPVSEFHKDTTRKPGYRLDCKDCRKFLRKDINKPAGLKISKEDVLLMRGLPCEICGCNKATSCIDHCHKTNKIRGSLCRTCNIGLGMFKDSQNLLQAAIDYLYRKQKSTKK